MSDLVCPRDRKFLEKSEKKWESGCALKRRGGGGLPHRLVLGHGRRSWQLISVIDLPDERGREGVLVLLEPGPAQRPR